MPCKGTVGGIRRGYQSISSRCIDCIYIVHKYVLCASHKPHSDREIQRRFHYGPGAVPGVAFLGGWEPSDVGLWNHPPVDAQFLTYLLYRWEVVIRTTVVVGFVSAGGLGRDFRLSLSFFQHTDVALMILWYLVLVMAVGLLSAFLRRMVRAG